MGFHSQIHQFIKCKTKHREQKHATNQGKYKFMRGGDLKKRGGEGDVVPDHAWGGDLKLVLVDGRFGLRLLNFLVPTYL